MNIKKACSLLVAIAWAISVINSANAVTTIDTASGSSPGSGIGIYDEFFPFHRIELPTDATITKAGGTFLTFFPKSDSQTIFGAFIRLANGFDFPDNPIGLSGSDLVSTFLLNIPGADPFLSPQFATTNVNIDLDAGWYAMVFGSGKFGAPSITTGARLGMASLATDLAPSQVPYSIRQSTGDFIGQAATPNFHLEYTQNVPDSSLSWTPLLTLLLLFSIRRKNELP